MGRAPCCDKVGLKKGKWTAEEDQKLLKYIEEHGEGSWRSLPKNAGLLRCGKSCRLRWVNYLRADLKKGNISKEEEEIIIRLHASLGNRWSLIAEHLPGRTDNEIKNYWNSHLSRSIFSYRKFSGEGSYIDISNLCNERKRRRGRISRSAMKKNNTRFNEKREREMQLQEQNNVVGTMVQVEQDSGINWDSFDEELLQNNLLLEFGAHEERSSSGGGDEEEDIGSYLVFGGEGGGSDQNIVLEFEKREEGVEVVASGEEGVMQEACCKDWDQGEEELWPLMWDWDGENAFKVWDQGEEELWPWMWDGENENGLFGIEGMEINCCQEGYSQSV